MIRNYLIIAWRNLYKHKLHSLIHIVGLSTGVAACLLIFLFVRYELTYDQHNEHCERIARITTTLHTPESDNLSLATTPYPLADALLREYPEVENVVRLETSPATVTYKNELITEAGFYQADQSIFSIFSFSVIAGAEKDALTKPNQLVITERIAKKYFGSAEEAVGNVLVSGQQPLHVTAVVADLPANSDIRIEGLLSANFSEVTSWMEDDFPVYTFVLFNEKLDLRGFEQKVQRLAKQYVQPELDEMGAVDYHARFLVESLADVHFSKGKLLDTPKGNKQFNYVFSVLALVILVIALLNYINLATAKASERGKEVGIRKVAGARPLELVRQFVIESFLLIGVAWAVAIGLMLLSIPYVNLLLGTQLSFHWQDHAVFLAGTFIATTFFTSLYPAFALAGYRPVDVLKGNRKISLKGISLRKGTVVVQFAAAIVLTIGTLVVHQQVQYIANANQAFNTNQVVSIRVPTDDVDRSNVNGFYEALCQLPAVQSITSGNGVQGEDVALATTLASNNGEQRHLFCNYFFIDADFIPFFQVQLLEGRNLSDSLPTDREAAFLVNEAFVHAMGWSNASAIGQPVEGFDRKGKVVGVVENFFYKSMHNLVEPLAMIYHTGAPWFISVKISPSNLPKVKLLWQRLFPDKVFDYTFLDEAYAAQYRKDTVTMYLFSCFTALAILIACLGLYGLVSMMTARRTKEIGIRKVLGASVRGIVSLLSKDFVMLVLVAVATACPIAWWAMDKWLENFAYRIDIQWWMFAAAGVAAVVITLLTVCGQAVRAATANPVECLRDE
ncbi:ABC transporter permease [Parapedobacter sp. ISTM3]|uniref:ABC transporter permease n=1 Tax=Parapedobacter sp. ISTM3 TaxID=2800130 RepID=UPI0019059B90|nr:ABC transporter permease [Parapedobacter sp. ISTM3]MBK1441218.1 ABC transporter permease [Parapedobacter sp. ISTM3]